MKVPVEFQYDYENDRVLPTTVARIHIGDHIGRLYFTPNGKTVLAIAESALTDGSIIAFKESTGFGLEFIVEDKE